MSIFKLKSWWSNQTLQDQNQFKGLQNERCLKVERFRAYSDSDCIVLCEDSLLRIFRPGPEEGSHLVIETRLPSAVLQVDTGKFVSGLEDRQILVLHPQCYVIYELQSKEGHDDAGEQNILHQLLKHSFKRRAYKAVSGPFGYNKSRDLICVQGLDDSLSFFDQDTFLFMCVSDTAIVPRQVAYVAHSDSFVMSQSTWVLEVYSYQQLRELSDLGARQNKKVNPQWVYNAGEEISAIQVIQTSTNFSSIVALGERYLYCFQDNGLLKYVKKFDFMPVCFFAYLVGWYYQPGARLLVMVASEESKLNIYEGTTLLWSCAMAQVSIALSRCYLKNLSGGIVALTSDGVVSTTYLGTEPELNPSAVPTPNDAMDPKKVEEELEVVEEALRRVMDNNEEIGNGERSTEEMIKIQVDAGKPVIKQQFAETNEYNNVLTSPITVIMTCDEPRLIEAVQITFVCTPPFACLDTTVCLEAINGTEVVETHIFLSNDMDISDTSMRILFTVTEATGKIVVLTKSVMLPLSLYGSPADVADKGFVIEVESSKPCVDLMELFTDFTKEDLVEHGSSAETVSFLYTGNHKSITIYARNQTYSLESNDSSQIIPLMQYLIYKVTEHYGRVNNTSVKLNVNLNKELEVKLIHRFLKTIDAHAKERIKVKSVEAKLDVLQKQFTLVQKRLLIQYGSSPPGDCETLELLMRDTHRRLTDAVGQVDECRKNVTSAVCTMAAMGQLIMQVLRLAPSGQSNLALVEEMLALHSFHDDFQDWEEGVAQGLTYLLNNIFNKSEKDREKLALITEHGILSQVNLKKFLKQLKQMLEVTFAECYHTETPSGSTSNKINRIEEIVEVI